MGPLEGLRVVEVAGVGPTPFCAMLLADLGADVLRLDRADAVDDGTGAPPAEHALGRGRRSVAIDLKRRGAAAVVLRLAETADVLIEGFRPGVAERLGIGPDACLARNPGLVYGRMTGWGQEGARAGEPGHDLNYIALAGVLDAIGRDGQPPTPPLNLVGDYGGGGLLLAFGILAALLERRGSGRGQVIDAAMVDGAALLATLFFGLRDQGRWSARRGANLLDGGAPFYDVYETADGRWVSVAAIEPQFYAELLAVLELDPAGLPDRDDAERWPELRERFAAVFRTRTLAQWCAAMAGRDVCFAPVLTFDEARRDPELVRRGTFADCGGAVQPAPAPRFSRTPAAIAGPPPLPGQDSGTALPAWGFQPAEVAALLEDGVLVSSARSSR